MKNYQQFYQVLGNLFYSIAATDGDIREQETATVNELVKKNWLALEDSEDSFGMDNAHIISITYDVLYADRKNADDAWEEFVQFYKLNGEYFGGKVKPVILSTARDIADAFGNVNKREEARISALKELFGN